MESLTPKELYGPVLFVLLVAVALRRSGWRAFVWVGLPALAVLANEQWHFTQPKSGAPPEESFILFSLMGLGAAWSLTALVGWISALRPATPLEASRVKIRQTEGRLYQCRDEIRELENRAGIETNHLWIGQLRHPGEHPFVRDRYFSVSDFALKNALMAKHYEWDELVSQLAKHQLDEAQAEVDEAKATLLKMRASGRNAQGAWFLPACIWGIGWVYGGHLLFQTWEMDPILGAICGAVVGILSGRQFEQTEKYDKNQNKKYASRRLKKAKSRLAKTYSNMPSELPLFSMDEIVAAGIILPADTVTPPPSNSAGQSLMQRLPRDKGFWIFTVCFLTVLVLMVILLLTRWP